MRQPSIRGPTTAASQERGERDRQTDRHDRLTGGRHARRMSEPIHPTPTVPSMVSSGSQHRRPTSMPCTYVRAGLDGVVASGLGAPSNWPHIPAHWISRGFICLVGHGKIPPMLAGHPRSVSSPPLSLPPATLLSLYIHLSTFKASIFYLFTPPAASPSALSRSWI